MAKGKRRPDRAPVPPPFVPPRVAELLGPETDMLLDALNHPAPVSIRTNPWKPGGPEGTMVPWCSSGRYLHERPSFTLDPAWHAGSYYVQEASSMLVEQAFKAMDVAGKRIAALDLCAAPGGKSTHLAALLSPGSLLVANEPVPQRRRILAENIWKQGRPGTAIGAAVPERYAEAGILFDLVLVDAPCSGQGMFRKDPFARAQWNDRLVDSCARLQSGILDSAWQVLAPGGHLIYSTCTWEPRENEEQMQRLLALGAEELPLVLPAEWGMVGSGPGLRCYPHKVRGEGFYIAVLRKPGGWVENAMAHHDAPLVQGTLPEAQLQAMPHAGTVYAVTAPWWGLVERCTQAGLLEHPGTPVFDMAQGPERPHAALALSTALDPAAWTAVEVDDARALAYLRGETIAANNASGPGLVHWNMRPLGWVHGAGNRWNNRWPAPWRIRQR